MNNYILSLLFVIISCLSNCNAQIKDFKIFNALLYRNTPNLESYGFKKIYLFYEDDLLDKRATPSNTNPGGIINYSKIKRAAEKSLLNPNIPVCLDIESWPLEDAHRQNSRNKYLKVLNYFKSINVKSKVGYYGVYPMDSPHADYNFESPIRESVIMPKWHESNNFVKNIGQNSNVFFPAFYTRYKDHDTWVKIVKEKVAKIKEVNTKAKVYGFIWPQYYFEDGKYEFIEAKIWKKQLEILYKYCDGAVIWSHYNGPNGTPIDFSLNMEWFRETVKFIKENNIN